MTVVYILLVVALLIAAAVLLAAEIFDRLERRRDAEESPPRVEENARPHGNVVVLHRERSE